MVFTFQNWPDFQYFNCLVQPSSQPCEIVKKKLLVIHEDSV